MVDINLRDFLISCENTIAEAMACIDRNTKGITLVVDDERRLVDTVTDGDIRRAILSGVELNNTVTKLLSQKPGYPDTKPLSAPAGTSQSVLLSIMERARIHQLPILDEFGRVVDLVTMDNLLSELNILPKKNRIEKFFISLNNTVSETMACIESNAKGIALIVDEEKHLLHTVTDGDIRRAILDGIELESPITEVLTHEFGQICPKPFSAFQRTGRAELINIMHSAKILQLPLLDEENHVVDIVTLDDLIPMHGLPIQATVMAGGLGIRLRPLTQDLPKPMLPIGDQPLIERIISQLRNAGIQNITITTHFKPEKIEQHFGDGQDFGVKINYITEDRPLGTAGAIGLMKPLDQLMLVINGDILTDVNLQAMVAFHHENNADLTVGVRKIDLQVPYGVIETEGALVKALKEKPHYTYFVNAGIYLLDPCVHQIIPNGVFFDMTDLIDQLISLRKTVVSFPIVEYWMDIGQPENYRKAQMDFG